MPLFHKRVLEKHSNLIKEFPEGHKYILKNWADNLEKGIYNSETQNDSEFIQHILKDILGYKGSSHGELWTVAKNEPVGKGNVDVALGSFTATSSKIIAPLELKGAKTKDLDAIMSGRNKTPVQQAWEYAMDAKGAQWVLVSNYREIRLYAVGYGRKEYEKFDLLTLSNHENYARFILLLSAENLLNGKTWALLQESEQTEKDITDSLYKDYKDLRARLIGTLTKENPDRKPISIIQSTQTILDRILFIAFAEDKGLLPQRTLNNAYESQNNFNPQPIWDNFKGLFHAINKGNATLNIHAYNGGLFADNKDINSLSISNELCEEFKKLGEYDFDSDVSVNILGHIFEQSITDLEELKSIAESKNKDNQIEFDKKKSKRKKDGIFYTPPYITRYIVEQAVGGWLSDKREELGYNKLPTLTDEDYETVKVTGKKKLKFEHNKNIAQHILFWESYKNALSKIKVLDPACGSGAFLNEVFDFLKNEGQTINNELARLTSGQTALFRWDTHILANNIYGVDLNNESVEITKLSLWLKTANKNEKLTYLENNIKAGNSLIDDPLVAGETAFDWNKEFPEIMQLGGFDVVIGNPPYGASLDKNSLQYIEKRFKSYEYQSNTYVIFYEQGIKLLNQNGLLGFITPATFLHQHYFQRIRHLLSAYNLISINKYIYPVFEDADIGDTVSFVIKKNRMINEKVKILVSANKEQAEHKQRTISLKELINQDGTFSIQSKALPEKIYKNPTLGEISNIVVGVKAYQTGKGIPKQDSKIVSTKPFTAFSFNPPPYKLCIIGSNFHRYRFLEKPEMYLKYGDWLAEPRKDAPFFESEKIIIRQTSDTIIAHLDTTKSINLNNVYNIGSIAENYSPKYLLGVLNSNLMKAIYSDIAQEKGKLFAEVKKVYLKKLPITQPTLSERTAVETYVENIINLYSKLYDLTQNFSNLLKTEFSLNEIGKLLLNYHSLEQGKFISELEKSIKPRKLSLSQKSEWISYFEKEKTKALGIKSEIEKLENEINNKVYELYCLTEEEKQAIENSL